MSEPVLGIEPKPSECKLDTILTSLPYSLWKNTERKGRGNGHTLECASLRLWFHEQTPPDSRAFFCVIDGLETTYSFRTTNLKREQRPGKLSAEDVQASYDVFSTQKSEVGSL